MISIRSFPDKEVKAMNWSKYYFSVDERNSVIAVAVGEKVVVRGRVFHSKPMQFNGHDTVSPGAPVIDQPQIFCDIHTNETWLPKVETKQFVPDAQGNFEFEIDTTLYAPGMYYLWVFYAVGEDSDKITRHPKNFFIFPQQEIDDLKKLIS